MFAPRLLFVRLCSYSAISLPAVLLIGFLIVVAVLGQRIDVNCPEIRIFPGGSHVFLGNFLWNWRSHELERPAGA